MFTVSNACLRSRHECLLGVKTAMNRVMLKVVECVINEVGSGSDGKRGGLAPDGD